MMVTNDRGIGFHNWAPSFLAGKYRFKQTKTDKDSLKKPMPIIYKAPHSSYVCIGAELGYTGFFLFFGILYCCLRSVITARTSTPDEERCRRIIFVLVFSYMVSSWMVDFEYRPSFFMFAAAAAALHRHLLGLNEEKDLEMSADAERAERPHLPAWRARLVPEPALAGAASPIGTSAPVFSLQPLPAHEREPEPEPAPVARVARAWNRIGVLDVAIALAMTYAAIRYWSYLLTNM